jgi:hypothetical protein
LLIAELGYGNVRQDCIERVCAFARPTSATSRVTRDTCVIGAGYGIDRGPHHTSGNLANSDMRLIAAASSMKRLFWRMTHGRFGELTIVLMQFMRKGVSPHGMAVLSCSHPVRHQRTRAITRRKHRRGDRGCWPEQNRRAAFRRLQGGRSNRPRRAVRETID